MGSVLDERKGRTEIDEGEYSRANTKTHRYKDEAVRTGTEKNISCLEGRSIHPPVPFTCDIVCFGIYVLSAFTRRDHVLSKLHLV